jgi:hypothetical protein
MSASLPRAKPLVVVAVVDASALHARVISRAPAIVAKLAYGVSMAIDVARQPPRAAIVPPPAAGEPRIDSLPSTLAHLASAVIALDRPADPIRPDRRTAPLVRRALACVVAFAKTLGEI